MFSAFGTRDDYLTSQKTERLIRLGRYVYFEDVAIDRSYKNAKLQIDIKSPAVATINDDDPIHHAETDAFDLLGLFNVHLENPPTRTPTGCAVYPAPTLKLIGSNPSNTEEEVFVPIHLAATSVFILNCPPPSKDVQLASSTMENIIGVYVQEGDDADRMYINEEKGLFLKACPPPLFDSGSGGFRPCFIAGFWAITTDRDDCSKSAVELYTCDQAQLPATISVPWFKKQSDDSFKRLSGYTGSLYEVVLSIVPSSCDAADSPL
jgi:hypothetical protein